MTGAWAALVGWSKDGRNEVTRDVLDQLTVRGVRLTGCRQERLVDADGEISGYDLIGLADGRRYELARTSDDPVVCDWAFAQSTFDAIGQQVLSDAGSVAFLEIGPLEARGHGHWPTVERLLETPGRLVVLCIRPRALARIAVELPDPVAGLELPASSAEVQRFIEALAGDPTHQRA
jgi:nucleoside-triphosphatase THEP1